LLLSPKRPGPGSEFEEESESRRRAIEFYSVGTRIGVAEALRTCLFFRGGVVQWLFRNGFGF